jgi:hypothetical protein
MKQDRQSLYPADSKCKSFCAINSFEPNKTKTDRVGSVMRQHVEKDDCRTFDLTCRAMQQRRLELDFFVSGTRNGRIGARVEPKSDHGV